MGDSKYANSFRENLVQYLDNLQLTIMKISESYYDSMSYYTVTMQKTIKTGYISQNDLIKLHQNTKKESKIQVFLAINHFQQF